MNLFVALVRPSLKSKYNIQIAGPIRDLKAKKKPPKNRKKSEYSVMEMSKVMNSTTF